MPVHRVSRRTFGATLGASLLTAQPAKRPNIVFICSDQHSGLVMGCNGHPVVRTPNMDRLASLGMNFRNAYCGSPVCVPSRASMMTGMFASDVGSYCNSTPFDGRIPTWGNRLHDSGYFCWATGKLDLVEGKDYGFQEAKTGHGHSSGPDITSLFRAPLCYRVNERRSVDGNFRERVHSDEGRVRDGIEFLRSDAARKRQPWAMYVGLTLPHPAFVAHTRYRDLYPLDRMPLPKIPPDYLEQRHLAFQALANFKLISTPISEQRVRRARAAYYAMVTELDDHLGRLLEEIEKGAGLENTLVVYTTDHGEMLGEHGLWLKNVLLEGAARIPLILAGAGLPRGRTVEGPVSHADMVATMLDVAGAGVPSSLRGRSLRGSHPGYAFSESHSEGNCTGSFMIRKADWKYIYFSWYEPLLFNLKEDPGELRNLAGKPEFAAVQKELHAILTSLLDPDAVTRKAFDEQERRLMAMVRSKTPQEFMDELAGRLGRGQARVLANRYYRK